jgi:hypothetical protein
MERSRYDDLEARLIVILGMVNDWLKFAEAKNAVLVALSGAATGGILSYLSSNADVAASLVVGLVAAQLVLLLSLLVALVSFFPQTDLARWLTRNDEPTDESDNLYFYGHLAKYAPHDLVERIASLYVGTGQCPVPPYRSHLDLASQIVINSRIAAAKLRLFAIATALLVIAVFVGAAAVFVTIP